MRRTIGAIGAAIAAVLGLTATASAAELTKLSLIRSHGELGMPGDGSPYIFDEEQNGVTTKIFLIPLTDERVVARQVSLGPVQAGEEFNINAELQVMNDLLTHGSNGEVLDNDVQYNTQLVYSTSATATTGTEISEIGGENLPADTHYGQLQQSGTFKATAAYPELYVKLIVRAHATQGLPPGTVCYTARSTPEQQRPCGMDVKWKSGHLSALRLSNAATAPSISSFFEVINRSGSSEPTTRPAEMPLAFNSGQTRQFGTVFARAVGTLQEGDILDIATRLQLDGRSLTEPVDRCAVSISNELRLSPSPTDATAAGSVGLDVRSGSVYLDGRADTATGRVRGTSMMERTAFGRSITWQANKDYAVPMYLTIFGSAYGNANCVQTSSSKVLIDHSRSYARAAVYAKRTKPTMAGTTLNSGDSSELATALDGSTQQPLAVYALNLPSVRAGEVIMGSAMGRVSTSYYEVYPAMRGRVDVTRASVAGTALNPESFSELNPYAYSYHFNNPFWWTVPAGSTGDRWLNFVMSASLGDTWSGSPPNGLVPVRPDAGRLAAARFSPVLDGIAPAITLSGGLREPIGGDRDLHIKATDGGSGVRSIKVWLDPQGEPPTDAPDVVFDEPCVPSCPAVSERDYVLPPGTPEGPHTIRVEATDDTGNDASQRWNVHVSRLDSVDRSRLGLEQWFQYDETPAGGDSTAYVNIDNGNAIWHSTPVVNRGRGLSTVVNLTYNSQDLGGAFSSALGREPLLAGQTPLDAEALTDLSYSQGGIGVSIGISGPTRVNEPLSGVLLAAASEEGKPLPGAQVPASPEGLTIGMTDADGTRHTFTRDAQGWRSPPGLNLRLRRYSDAGSAASPTNLKWAMARPDGVTHFFNNLGYLTYTIDRNNNKLKYSYDRIDAFSGAACATGAVVGELQVGNPSTLCTLRLSKVTDPGGRDLSLAYQTGALLDPLVDGLVPRRPAGLVIPIGGRPGRIKQITDHAGRTYDFEYENGYLTRLTEAANRTERRHTRLSYESATTGTPPMRPDRQLKQVREFRDDSRDGNFQDSEQYATTSLTYEARDNSPLTGLNSRKARRATAVTDRTGGYATISSRTQLGADAKVTVSRRLHRANASASELRAATTYTVDPQGRPIVANGPLGIQTELTWSADHKLERSSHGSYVSGISDVRSDESVIEMTYDTVNGTGVLESRTEYPNWPDVSEARRTDPVWSFGPGRWQSSAAAAPDTGGTFVADLDRVDNPRAGTSLDFTFDSRGNVTMQTDASGASVAATYDSTNGNLLSERDELGHAITYDATKYHPTGQPTEAIDKRGQTWTYGYDTGGNLATVVDPRAADRSGAASNPYTTTLTYDAFDRLVEERVPRLSDPSIELVDGESRYAVRKREFDRNGNLTRFTDAENADTRLAYNKMDSPIQVTRPGSGEGPETTTHVYDEAQRLIAEIGPKGDPSRATSVLDEHQAACAGGTSPVAFTTRYCLDARGRLRAQVRYSTRTGDPAQLIESYAVDRRDNRISQVDPNRNAGRTVGDAITASESPSNVRTALAYDKLDELIRTTDPPAQP